MVDFRKNDGEESIPQPGRPEMPQDYGVPEQVENVLPWSFVEERMQAARNYWICTTRPDGRPHAMPVWGVWHEGRLYIEGSPETVRHRNIVNNPAVAVHLESGDEVVILEGWAEVSWPPPRALAVTLSEAFTSKYEVAGYAPGPEQWDRGDLYAIRPEKAFAWTRFPENVTRWRLARSG